MEPWLFMLIVFGVSIVAGLLGSMVGVGGGIVIVPVLTGVFNVEPRYAVGASIVAVIATSSGAAAGYVREGIANLRLAMLLEVATAAGAVGGAYLAGFVSAKVFFFIFGGQLLITVALMSRRGDARPHNLPHDRLADKLRLGGSYYDPAIKEQVTYRVSRTPVGLAVSLVAGMLSSLLGIGGGAMKVPAMNVAMGVPLKACTATSNLMIGVTAAAGALVYFTRGDVLPFLAAPVAAGVLIGASSGARLLPRTKSVVIRRLFVFVLAAIAIQMFVKGLRA